jgi:Regulator of chromosome condensation (RCC1) repeat/Putative Ig domain
LVLSLALAVGASAEGQSAAFATAQFSAGGAHSCAIRGDGALACWGDDSKGQLDGIPQGSFTAVSAGGAHSCAIRGDGALACWGDDSKGQLEGIPAGEFTAVSAGGAHSCAIRVGGALVCWGDDSKGQDAVRAGTFTSISAGGMHGCAIRATGHLACWGDDTAGQVSGAPGEWGEWHWYWHGTSSDFLAASAGGAHTCAIAVEGGSLECWGDHSQGRLDGIPAGGGFASVSAGGAHSCAIRGDGALACWGDDSKGQLDGIPQGSFTAVSAGGAHSCAAPAEGRLACWGDNAHGQSQPLIVSPDPSEATVGEPYRHYFNTTPQAPGPEFSIVSGQLPDGLALAANGLLSGVPSTADTYAFTVAASNGVTPDAEQDVTLEVIEVPQPPPVEAHVLAGPSGPPPPIAGESVNLDPAAGVVRTKCPGNQDFSRIETAVQIPLSCLVDARNGTVDLTASKGSSGATQSAFFWGGIFGVGQEVGDDKEAVMTLAGRLECEKRKLRKNGRVMLRSRGAGRRLWGSGKGDYATAGSHGAATVRGTTWLVADRCDGSTLFKVAEGTVWVSDFVKDTQVVLQAGDSYVARPEIDRLK